MKKGFAGILVTALVLICSRGFSSIERTLINFPTFEANMGKIVQKDAQIHSNVIKQNPQLDYAQYGYPTVSFTPSDWKLDQWMVVLTSSANTVENNIKSYTKAVPSKKFNGNVLGVRVHFPKWNYLSWAIVRPPFDFYVYYDNGEDVNPETANDADSTQTGVLVNVGMIKSVSAWIYGLNYPQQVGIRLINRDDVMQEYFMGSTFYDGWRKLVWMNPNYSDDVRDRVLQRLPLYPKSYPYVKFDSYVIYKPETNPGGDFVIYFKDVKLNYDRAIVREEQDINDEKAWGILSNLRLQKKNQELKTIGEQLYLRKQEEERQHAMGSNPTTTSTTSTTGK
jgi:hypothetical protein